MSEDNKDFEANSIDEILKEFQAKRDNNDLPGERRIDEPLAPPKPHTDFSNEKSLQKEPEAKKTKAKKPSFDFKKFDYSKLKKILKPTIIIVGNEANGISEDVQKMCQCVKIPILGKAESLNAGVAAAILMYELVRQRS